MTISKLTSGPPTIGLELPLDNDWTQKSQRQQLIRKMDRVGQITRAFFSLVEAQPVLTALSVLSCPNKKNPLK